MKLILKSFLLLTCIFTVIQPAPAETLKIGIANANRLSISSSSETKLINKKTNSTILKLNPRKVVTLERKKDLIKVKFDGFEVGAFQGPIKLLKTNPKGFVFCNETKYRGDLYIIFDKANSNKLIAINRVDIEDYLLSVVPSEMPHHWHLNALKAQTVAARSYALGYLGRRKAKGYDLESTVEDQVYLGVKSEKLKTKHAVEQTAGEILVDENGKPLITLFHSSGGGFTDSIEELWSNRDDISPSKFIQPKEDYDQSAPHFNWKRELTPEKLKNQRLEILTRTKGNRVKKIKLFTEDSSKEMYGEEFRMLFKLPSSKFDIAYNKDTGIYTLTGSGYGHGLGLSQWGAKALAKQSWDYKKILNHYYNGAKLVKIEPDIAKQVGQHVTLYINEN